jgi:hypothetical protein
MDRGTHNTSLSQIINALKSSGQSMNTNLEAKENLMLTHMPIMSKPFQERLNSHISEKNLSLNGENA